MRIKMCGQTTKSGFGGEDTRREESTWIFQRQPPFPGINIPAADPATEAAPTSLFRKLGPSRGLV